MGWKNRANFLVFMKPSIFSELSLTLTYFLFSGNSSKANSIAFVGEAKERGV